MRRPVTAAGVRLAKLTRVSQAIRRVGGSGLSVSRLGLGTMTWGADVSPATARDLVRRFSDSGGNLIDTAPAYGNGAAESIIGKLIHTEVRRDDLVIATKGGFGLHGGQRVVDTSRRALLDDLAGSLRRLHTDHVDLWQVHAWGPAPLEETLAALDHAVTSGMTRYVGVSNFVGWQTARAATWQQAVPGRGHLVSTQVEYSLVARRVELEVVPAALAHAMGVFPWSPIGRGVLTGKYRAGTPRDSRGGSDHLSWFVDPYLEPKYRAVVDAVCTAADGLGISARSGATAVGARRPGCHGAPAGGPHRGPTRRVPRRRRPGAARLDRLGPRRRDGRARTCCAEVVSAHGALPGCRQDGDVPAAPAQKIEKPGSRERRPASARRQLASTAVEDGDVALDLERDPQRVGRQFHRDAGGRGEVEGVHGEFEDADPEVGTQAHPAGQRRDDRRLAVVVDLAPPRGSR